MRPLRTRYFGPAELGINAISTGANGTFPATVVMVPVAQYSEFLVAFTWSSNATARHLINVMTQDVNAPSNLEQQLTATGKTTFAMNSRTIWYRFGWAGGLVSMNPDAGPVDVVPILTNQYVPATALGFRVTITAFVAGTVSARMWAQ